jgi:ribosomal protein S12 methylthiotransferase accessory factor
LAALGIEPVVVNMTTEDAEACNLAVVKVLAPPCDLLEGDHSMPFLGGRRWREVPARIGLRSHPMGLADINPQPHPYP